MKSKTLIYLQRNQYAALWFSILLGFALTTAILEFFHVDLKISGLFYATGKGWYLANMQPWKWLYQYGTIVGLILTLGSLALWALSYFIPGLVSWRKYFLLIFFTAIIGGGFVVNILLKDYWGRPRPINLVNFDAGKVYRAILSFPEPGRGQSFPCGHCTMGYLMITLFYLREKSKTIAYIGGSTGILYGMMVSGARIVQGGHFFSDGLWAFGVILLTSLALKPLLWRKEPSKLGVWVSQSWKRKLIFSLGIFIALAGMTTAFMTRRPYSNVQTAHLLLAPATTSIRIDTNFPEQKFTIKRHNAPYLRIKMDAHGFGWTQATYLMHAKLSPAVNKQQFLNVTAKKTHYFSELNKKFILYLPADRQIEIVFPKKDQKQQDNLEK